MRVISSYFCFFALLFSLIGGGLETHAPDHDHHHVGIEFSSEIAQTPDLDKSDFLHTACGVCHHMIGGAEHLQLVVFVSQHHGQDWINERVSSRAIKPPFEPPIVVSA